MTEDLASLRKQLVEAETNLRLLRERKSQYVQDTDIPLQLIKDERRIESERERILGLIADQETGAVSAGAAAPLASGAKRGGAQYLKEHQAVVAAIIGLIGVVLAAVIGVLPELLARQEPAPAASAPVVQAAPTHTATPTASSVAGPSSTATQPGGGFSAGNTPMNASTQTATPTPVSPDVTAPASPPATTPTTPPLSEATPTWTLAPPTATATATATPTATVTPTATEAPEIENLLSDILGDLSHAYEAALPDLEANWHPLLDEYFCGSRADRKRENWRNWLINTFGVKIRAINPYSDLWSVQMIDDGWRVRQVETWCYENLTPQGTQLRVKQEQHLYTYYFQHNQQSDDPSFCIYDYETSARYYAYEGDERLLCGR